MCLVPRSFLSIWTRVIDPFGSFLQPFYQNGFFLKQIIGMCLFWPKFRIKLTIWGCDDRLSKKDETTILDSYFVLTWQSSNLKLLVCHTSIQQFEIASSSFLLTRLSSPHIVNLTLNFGQNKPMSLICFRKNLFW